MIKVWTTYPIPLREDTTEYMWDGDVLIRSCNAIAYDGNKYVICDFNGTLLTIKSGYLTKSCTPYFWHEKPIDFSEIKNLKLFKELDDRIHGTTKSI